MLNESFENKVKEELVGLKIKPSAGVWEGVDSALGVNKKRHQWRWYIPLVTLLIGSSVYFYLQSGREADLAPINKPSAKINMLSDNKIAETMPEEQQSKLSYSVSDNHQNDNKKKNIIHNKTAQLLESANKLDKIDLIIGKTTKDYEEDSATNNNVLNAKMIPDSGKENQFFTETNEAGGNELLTENLQRDSQIHHLSLIDSGLMMNHSPLSETAIDTASPKKNKNRVWTWNLLLKGGLSTAAVNLSDVVAQQAAISGGTASMAFLNPISSGLTYGFGTEVERRIGKKSTLSIVFNYQRVKTVTRVDHLLDMTSRYANFAFTGFNNYYYPKGDKYVYNNVFNFLQASIHYHIPVKLIKDIPFRITGGVGISRLFAKTRAIHIAYRNNDWYYLSNHDLYKRVQMNVSGGLDIGLSKKADIFITPSLTLFINRQAKTSEVISQYFLLAETKLKIPFNRKQR